MMHYFRLYKNVSCLLVIIIALVSLFAGCRKVVPESKLNTDTFFKVYSEPGNQACYSIQPTSDGGFLLIGLNDDGATMRMLKTDKNGVQLWAKSIEGKNFSNILIRNLDDGTFIVNIGHTLTGSGTMAQFDENGNLLFETTLANSYAVKSTALKRYDGSFVIGSSVGNNTPNMCRVQHYDSQGKYLNSIDINDNSFEPGFKELAIIPIKVNADGTYYFSGYCYPNWNGNPRNVKAKVYISKQKYSGTTLVQNKLLKINDPNISYDYGYLRVDTTTTGDLFLTVSVWDPNGIPHGKIIKVDTNLNVSWEKDFYIGKKYTVCTNFTECPDGGFLITGISDIPDKSSGQPFACKFDRNGNMLWSKLFRTALFAEFDIGIQDKEGNCFFTGYTNAFGQGEASADFILMKTDANGELK